MVAAIGTGENKLSGDESKVRIDVKLSATEGNVISTTPITRSRWEVVL